MSAQNPKKLRRFGLKVFKRLPPKVSHGIVHVLETSYTAGAVVIIEHDGRVLALRQLHRKGWSLPGGLIERGEQPADAVAREVFEETGIRIDPGQAMAIDFVPDIKHIDIIFRVECDELPEVRVASEALKSGWFSMDELPEPDKSTQRILRAVHLARRTPSVGRVLAEADGSNQDDKGV